MNSQFLPPQPMGNPQQGFQPPPPQQQGFQPPPPQQQGFQPPPPQQQGFQPPQPQQQGFQNVSLIAPPKSEGGPPQIGGPGLPPQQHFAPPSGNMPQPPRQFTSGQVRPSQFPPSQLPPSQPPLQRPPNQNSNMSSAGLQNGPPQGMPLPRSAFSNVPPNQFGQNPQQQMPPRPGSNQPQFSQNLSNLPPPAASAQMPSNPNRMAQSPPTSTSFGPGSKLPSNPSSMAQSVPTTAAPPQMPGSVSQTGMDTFAETPPINTSGNKPLNNGPPGFQPPHGSNNPPSSQSGFPSSFNGSLPPTSVSQVGPPPPVSSGSGMPAPGDSPASANQQRNNGSSLPPTLNHGSLQNGNHPPTSQPPQFGNMPLSSSNQPPQNQTGGLPPSQSSGGQGLNGPPLQRFVDPSFGPGGATRPQPPQNVNQPPTNQQAEFGAMPPMNSAAFPPPVGSQPQSNHFDGSAPSYLSGMPPMSQGMPPLGGGQSLNGPSPQFGPGALARPPVSGAPVGAPHMGARPPQNYPPMPGQQPPTGNQPFAQPQFGQPMGQLGQLGGQMPPGGNLGPPGPGQVTGPNRLAHQMQGMSLGGPRQYPKNFMNGENGPHMPPPLNQQQQYLNGQQQPPSSQPAMNRPPAPGYPPMPQAPAPGTYQQQPPMGAPMAGNYPQQPGYPQNNQQQKKLDPDQMPNPIQVTEDDQRNRSGPFVTNQKGLLPPLVTTNFVVQDQGNASPRFIRSTMYNVPVTQDIMKQTAVPFALAISPMARTLEEEYPPPIVNFGELGPVRCIRCKAYMCPYMQFIDSGRRFQCLFCKATTDVPTEYFQHLDHTGQRMDRFERPELILGTYEFVATADYCRNNTLPKPPAFVFVIDVSYNNIKSGVVQLLCSQMKEILKNLPADQGCDKSNMRVGFITYNSSVHFYNIKGTLAAPQMMVVGDTQEMFMPLLDGFLSTPEESESVIDSLMEQIPVMFGETKECETVLLPAILGGLEALKASECAGKLLVFHSSLPTAEAPGKLKNRDDRKLLATDKERTILTPQTQAYNQLGQDCVQVGCSVDLFVFNNSFIDIATIGQVARLTGGEVFKYTYFQADLDGDRLIRDIMMDLSRSIAFDSIMRVRTSTGIRPTDFYGHFFMSNTTDMELASIDCDKAVAVEIKHDDKLSEEEGVYIQAALLYTSVSGQRRLRIINLSLKTCSQMSDLYRSCDLDTVVNYLAKQSTFKLLENSPKAVKDGIVSRAAQILATYRKNCASPSSAGQLILPECMKLLPLYANCLLKSDALSGGSDMTIDDRAFVMQAVMTMDVQTSVNYFYPRLIPLHDIDVSKEQFDIPAPIRCSVEKLSDGGVYLLENGIHMFIWIGLGASSEFTSNVFGAPSAIQVDIERTSLPELDNPLSLAIRNIIEEVRLQRHRCMRLTIVRQREKLEPVFKHFLVEDRGTDGSASYVDFLCHMHREIRNLLS